MALPATTGDLAAAEAAADAELAADAADDSRPSGSAPSLWVS
jgi:hypothetical protein